MTLLRALAALHDAIQAARDWTAAHVHAEEGLLAVTVGPWHVAAVRLDNGCTCGDHEPDPDVPTRQRWETTPESVEQWLRAVADGMDPAELMVQLDLLGVGDDVETEEVGR